MGIVLLVVMGLVIFAIAAVTVGTVVGQSRGQARQSVFDVEEAALWVGEQLPDEVQSQLSYTDVEELLGWYIDYLEEHGVAYERDAERAEDADSGALVVDEDKALAYVIGRASETEMDVTDEEVVVVVDGTINYLTAIGAIGSAVAEPDDGGPATPRQR